VLLLKSGPTATPAPGAWDTPGGRFEFGETLDQALQREIREELGTSASVRVRHVLNAWTFVKNRRTPLIASRSSAISKAPPKSPTIPNTPRSSGSRSRALRDPAIGESLRNTLSSYTRTRGRRRTRR
jgi:hypothetical protein